MAQWMPTYSGSLSDEERAMVAGFILHHRGQILRGLTAAREAPAYTPSWWTAGMEAHFKSGEKWTRLWLWYLGYKVDEDLQYPEFSDADNETARIIRDVESRGWVGGPGAE
jgi:hypothetical protein